MEPITVNVDSEIADVYRASSDEKRRKLDLLVNLRLRDATASEENLEDVMREISQKAIDRGLTPEMLESILADE